MKTYKQYTDSTNYALSLKPYELHIMIKRLLADYTYKGGECAAVIKATAGKNLDINFKDNYGWTLLSYASYVGLDDVMVLLLLQPDIDANITGPNNKSDFIELYSQCHKHLTDDDRLSLINNTRLTDLDFQKAIVKTNPQNIIPFVKHGLIHPDLKEEYPYLGSGIDLNLL